ncbi:hypothetical protein U4E84_01670 [Halorubrum sp. AD140]|uniref:hypothetical protein n=1 Tax=Halorubrum sp. AD140 TaxID=3050073 RepID=UPI002ACCFD9D|nr:hypothetical protein [Halorubrum sp. AD140]MDZ5810063.1 hypothetical protein [Halorubrum sp. AD140]
MFDRNTTAGLVVALVAIVGVGLAVAAGGAVAQDGSGELLNETADVTNDTESVYLDVVGNDSMDSDGPVNVTVTLTGLEEDQDLTNGTELDESDLSIDEGATESYDYELNDSEREDYDELAIVVDTKDDEELVNSTDWGTLQQVSGGGGGGGLDVPGGSTGVIVLVVVVLGAAFLTRDE